MSQPNVENATALESLDSAAVAETQQNYSKQSLNIYTVMLIIAFVCLFIAIIVLVYNLTSQWEGLPFPYRTGSARPVFNMLQPFLW